MRSLVLNYTKIHSSPKDCMLFFNKHKEANNCHKCGASRWKLKDTCVYDIVDCSSIPTKVLRCFPLTPWLQRLFLCD